MSWENASANVVGGLSAAGIDNIDVIEPVSAGFRSNYKSVSIKWALYDEGQALRGQRNAASTQQIGTVDCATSVVGNNATVVIAVRPSRSSRRLSVVTSVSLLPD